jgi:hypothetical protein
MPGQTDKRQTLTDRHVLKFQLDLVWLRMLPLPPLAPLHWVRGGVIVRLYRAFLPHGHRTFVSRAHKATSLTFLPVLTSSSHDAAHELRHTHGIILGAIRRVSLSSGNKLRVLKQEAELSPRDARKQADFLRALNETDPQAVVKRVESRKYGSSDGVLQEYAKALVSVMSRNGAENPGDGRHTFQQQQQRQQQQDQQDQHYQGQGQEMGGNRHGASGDLAMALHRGKKEPVVVAMTESSFKNQVWSTIRMLAVAYVLLLGVTTFMEEQGLSRTATQQHDVTKASHSTKTFADVVGVDEVLLYVHIWSLTTHVYGR